MSPFVPPTRPEVTVTGEPKVTPKSVDLRIWIVVPASQKAYTEWSGPNRARELLPALAPDMDVEQALAGRFAIIQVWRPIREVLENPLAIADSRSLHEGDLVTVERRYPDRVGQTYRLKHNPAHRWYYFPRMQPEEAIVFTVYDSARDGRARFTPHTAFKDPSSPPGAPHRQSIEARLNAPVAWLRASADAVTHFLGAGEADFRALSDVEDALAARPS